MSAARAHLGFSIAILACLAAALALAGPGGGPAPTSASSEANEAPARLDPAKLARISVALTAPTARRVERVRELRFEHLPRPEVVDSRFLNRLGLREVEHAGALGVGADDAFGAITGLLAPGETVAALYRSTGDLAAAAYDPRTERLYVVSDAVVANRALVEFVLAHELDHALEDQRFGLGGGGRLDADAALAHQALTEGSATDVMIEYARAYLDPLALLAAAQTIDAGAGDVPKALVDQLTWTYLGGRRFIDALRRIGGWRLVDYAFSDRPPATTEQVLHPRAYLRDELPEPVRPAATAMRRAGWRPAQAGVLGELASSQLLRVGLEPGRAKRAAAGWDGDGYELWRRDLAPAECEYPCRADLALVLRWAFDTRADARGFDEALDEYLREGLGAQRDGSRTWTLDGGHAAVATAERSAALVFAPDRRLARAAAADQVAAVRADPAAGD